MTYYRTCPECGANLDPGERCDCTPVRFFSVTTLATRWDVSVDLVYDLVRSGEVAAMKIGNTWRIPLSSVERYEEEQTHRITSQPKTKRKPVLRL